jgi:hypothetical protein
MAVPLSVPAGERLLAISQTSFLPAGAERSDLLIIRAVVWHTVRSGQETQGYNPITVSVSQLAETIYYIRNQVEHHRTRTFQKEYLVFLKRHELSTRRRLLLPGLSFDDKNLWD